MKRLVTIFIPLLILYSCEKHHYLKNVVGDYSGIIIHTSYIYGDTTLTYDTSAALLSLSKCCMGTKVELNISTVNYTTSYKFKYKNNVFVSTHEPGHVPELQINNDSLFFRYQPALGPGATSCYAKKF